MRKNNKNVGKRLKKAASVGGKSELQKADQFGDPI
jgi:hypothetical protein